MVTKTKLLKPFAVPAQSSPMAAALASFSKRTAALGQWRSRAAWRPGALIWMLAPDLLSLLGGGAQKGGYAVGDRRVAGGVDERGRRDASLAQELARLVE
mgnify:CR=1 FL=1